MMQDTRKMQQMKRARQELQQAKRAQLDKIPPEPKNRSTHFAALGISVKSPGAQGQGHSQQKVTDQFVHLKNIFELSVGVMSKTVM